MGQNLDPNPHSFGNPALPMYIGALVLAPYFGYLLLFRLEFVSSLHSLPYAAESLSQVPGDFITNVIIILRLASVVFSLLALIIIYIVTKRAFNRRTALLSCFLLALSPVFIPHAKFATINIYLLFFLWTSLLFQQRYLDTGHQKDLSFAAVLVGLAMASKYSGVFGALFLPLALLLKAKPASLPKAITRLFKGDMLKAAFLAAAIFLLVNPWPILAPKEVFEKLVYEKVFDMWTTGITKFEWNPTAPRTRGWAKYPSIIFEEMTPPVFLLAIFGIAMVARRSWRERGSLEGRGLLQLHLLLWLLFYYVIGVGAWVSACSRYLLPIVPAVIIFAAAGLDRIWDIRGRGRSLSGGAVVFILLFAAFNGALVAYEFTDESRYRAGGWLQEHLSPDDTIGYFSQQRVYLPPFPQGVTSVFLPFIHNLSITGEEFQGHTAALSEAGPDYLVLTSRYYSRFYGGQPTQRTMFYDELMEGRHPVYKPVAEFSQHDILGYSVPIDFVSPTIVVLKRMNPPE